MPSGLWVQKSRPLHERVSQALVVAVPIRCKHQQLVLRYGTVQRWSAGVCKHSCTKTTLAPRIHLSAQMSQSMPALKHPGRDASDA